MRRDPARAAIRIVFVLLSLAAIAWDLPSSFSWENDGVAPRDIFAGVAENLIPGSAFRYPLLHPLLLALLSLPVLLPAALGARSHALADLETAILTTPVMTTCALMGRLVAIAAAVVALAALGRIATRLAGRRVGLWTEAFAAVNLSVAYYGRATNLDGPALMWTALAVERLVQAGTLASGGAVGDAEQESARHLAGFAMCAAASIATKDQAYASYVLLVPFSLIAISLARGAPSASAARPAARPAAPPALSFRAIARAAGLGAITYGLASGALLNPTGFLTRVRTLGGSASADYRAYARGAAGVAANLYDLFVAQADYWWPWPIVALAWGGVALAIAAVVRAGARDQLIWWLAPLCAGLGSLVGFALLVGRAEHRFVLPLGFWLAFYLATAIEQVRVWAGVHMPRVVSPITGVACGLLVLGLLASLSLVLTQWLDGRRTVERWLAARPRGTTVETYGPLVYLPRFQSRPAAPYHVVRVGPEAIAFRNPQPGMDERQDRIADAVARRADVLILPEGFALPYLQEPPAGARQLPEVTRRARQDRPTLEFARAAVADALPGYRLCFVARSAVPPPFAVRRIHGSTGARTWVLARAAIAASACGSGDQ